MIVVFSASFAYFSVTSANNATNTNVQGSAASKGNALLTTNTSNLYSNLDAVMMSQTNIGTVYYATTATNGTPITTPTQGNGIYTLATATVSGGETAYNCSYKFKLTATLTRPITDGSDEDIKVKLTGTSIPAGSVEYTLKQLLAAGAAGIEVAGTFSNLMPGQNQTISIQGTTENTADPQNDFAGNAYTITVNPVKTADGFACQVVGA